MRKIAILFLICVAFAAACRTGDVRPSSGETRAVTDSLGRTVRLPMRIERAVSLAPSMTEMIFAAGAGDRLVGVTTYCNYPAETASIEKVGDTQSPNLEKILALRPQVVFVSTASQLEAYMETLDEQGIVVYVENSSSLDQVLQGIQLLGSFFDTRDTADRVSSSLNARLAKVRRERVRPSPRVFVQISNEPLFTIGKDSFLSPVIQDAGGYCVTSHIPSAYPKISKETAAAENPDVIILSDSDDNREPNPAFKDSRAVKTGRVYRVNADIISRPGPRLVDALEEIAAKLAESH
ncbi:MAG TPA: cobalamin-binding protein [Pyrinomonadaceae bacterium]|nr:cobalamin-binding protein [Pyrinomonadaceae bacterium]